MVSQYLIRSIGRCQQLVVGGGGGGRGLQFLINYDINYDINVYSPPPPPQPSSDVHSVDWYVDVQSQYVIAG